MPDKILNFMMNKKVWPLLLLILFGGIFWAFTSLDNNKEDPDAKQEKLLAAIGMILEERHYNPKPIDDDFSKKVFTEYLASLDPDKDIFLQSDIKELSKFSTTLDDEIKGNTSIQFYPAAGAIYLKRLDEAIAIYTDILSRPFDFTKNEVAQLDGEKLDYPADENAKREEWRKRLKFKTLERFVDLQQQREKSDGKDTAFNKTDAQFEEQARNREFATVNRSYNRLKLLFTDDEQFNSFVNTITNLMDPHTEYFAPVEKRGFDEEISGRFYGIGASLFEENGNVKITSLITGSPAWKSGEVQVNDKIIKVAQGDNTPIDVTGYAVQDVVKLIRGNKGTEVRITLKKADGTMKVVSIIRDEILLEDTFARSAIVNDGDKKIGYIFLPEFYIDYNNPSDGPRCSVDVAKEITKLKNEKVDGIVLDLRNNGGGSLPEVVKMVGLFIKGGPVVQVKGRDGKPYVWDDKDASVLYEGPLAVMVNELSASASEIFAAAIQDYKRGIIIGSTSTYGKGTVQTSLPLGNPLDVLSGQTEYGALKITFQKFYRINGGSTQLKGVTSDVILPDSYEYLKFREKDNPSALGWDQIPKVNYQPVDDFNIAEISKKEQEKVNKSPMFNSIQKNTDWLNKNVDGEYYLNLNSYKNEQKSIRKTVNQNDSLTRLDKPMEMKPLEVDNDKFYHNADTAKGERYKQWLKNSQKDVYINEAVNIVEDMAQVPNRNVASGKKDF